MDHQYHTLAKIPVLDTGKFERWQFRIQQYLQHEHYALWEVIKFGDSYKVPTNTDSVDSSSNDGRTVTITTDDMQKKKNDVKARTTLLLSLPDEHQLRFSKYKTAKELWAAILKTFGGNEATKKRKKNLLKQQYGNFNAEGTKTLEQTFNRLQVIRNRNDLDSMSLDDLYNHLKVYEAEVQKKPNSNSQDMAFISSIKNSNNEDGNTNNIDDKGYWNSGCSRHMTGNISCLSDSEPFDGGYVSFGQGGCKIIGKGTIKTDSECLVLGRNFKLLDDTNILLRTPRKHNMYSIDLN
nr:hypothetical protein [Tanacetum cinerariifolium]